MSNQVFVSYSHFDKVAVTVLLERINVVMKQEIEKAEKNQTDNTLHEDSSEDIGIENKGFMFWTDKNIKPGADWKKTIDDAIDRSFALIVMISDESMKSPYVTYEWSYADGKGLTIIPIQLERRVEEIHPKLKDRQIIERDAEINLEKKIIDMLDEEQIKSLTEGVAKHISNLMDMGEMQKQYHNYKNAINTYEDLLSIATKSFKDDIWYAIADCYLLWREERLDYAEKLNTLDHLTKRSLGIADADEDEARTDAETYLGKAQKALDQALVFNPYHTEAFIKYGEIFREQAEAEKDQKEKEKKFIEARNYFMKAVKYNSSALDNHGESIYASLGGIHRRLNDIDEAIDAYKNAVRVKRTSYPLNNLGLLFLHNEDYDNMVKYFRQVETFAGAKTQQNPGDEWAYNDLFVAQIIVVYDNEKSTSSVSARHLESAIDNADRTLTYLELFKDYVAPQVNTSLLKTLEELKSIKDITPTATKLVHEAIDLLS